MVFHKTSIYCDDADDDDDGNDDGDHDDGDEYADVGVDVGVDGDELAALFSHYCSSNESQSPVLRNRPLYKACGRMESLRRKLPAAACLWKACGCNGLWLLVMESL